MYTKTLLLSIYLLYQCNLCEVKTGNTANSKRLNDANENSETMTVPTSCLGLDDGYHYVKLLQDDIDNAISYPILYVQCSNEYIIINYDIEPEWDSYFTTWIKYHYGVVGPILNDKSNWSKWFLPDRFTQNNLERSGNYLVSPNCDKCSTESLLQLHSEKTAYYMSALAYGCFNPVRGWPACDFDYDTYQCKLCKWDDSLTQISSSRRDETLSWEDVVDSDFHSGICDFEIRSSIQETSQSFTKCAAQGDENKNWKPSLGIDGRFCQCYKPFHKKRTHITIQKTRLNDKIAKVDKFKEDKANAVDPTGELLDITKLDEHYLYQEDFIDGTYRIKKPGTYIIMEDIEFDFNPSPPRHYSPNSVHDNYYWPNEDDDDIYPGAGGSRDAFFLGFFAGITIECDNVIIDLNEKELKMSRPFYYQQPFFSIIELASQPFLPQQGPGMFGAEPHFATNVVIKNGIIGLSSHHGIHGNNNGGITIHDVVIKNFATHGVQLNGFEQLDMKNVEIGPSSQRAYLNGNYGQLRLLLPKMAKIAQLHKDDYIRFYGRLKEKVSMQDLLDKVVNMMDMVFNYVIDGETYDDHPDWDEAVRVFINPSGLPMGAVLYGLYLNYPSAGIFGWHVSDQTSKGATLENIYIHDLRHKGIEVVGFSQNGRVLANAFNGPIPAIDMFGEDQVYEFQSILYGDNNGDENEDKDPIYPEYVGSIITDIHIAMYYFGRDDFDNWAGIPFFGFGDKMVDWAMGKMPEFISSEDKHEFGFYCNEDAMFHPSKGLLGLKISGIEDLAMTNVKIENLQDETPIGSDLCGVVTNPRHGMYHFAQQLPYQVGFSMNMVMGMTVDFSNVIMEDTEITNLYSSTGLVYGMAAWFESDIDVNGRLHIKDLNAGSDLDSSLDFDYLDLPNKAPEACAIRLFDDSQYPLTINWNKYNGLESLQTCVNGQVGCLGDDDQFTHFDDIIKAEDMTDDMEKCSQVAPFEIAPKLFEDLLISESSFIPRPKAPQLDEEQNTIQTHDGHLLLAPWMNGNYIGFMFNNTFFIAMMFISLLTVICFITRMLFVNAKRSAKYENINSTELTSLMQQGA